MTMTTIKLLSRRLCSGVSPLPPAAPSRLAVLTASASPCFAQTVACMVNGEPITNLRYRAAYQAGLPDHPQAVARQDVINELIDEKVKLKEGKKFGVDPSAATSTSPTRDGSAHAAVGRPADQIAGEPGHPARDVEGPHQGRHGLDSLVRGRFKESLQVGEKDVNGAARARRRATQIEAFEYKMQPIVLIVPQGRRRRVELRKQGSRDPARARRELRGSQRLFKAMQNAAIRDTVTKTSADFRPAARAARQDADRPSDPAESPNRASRWWRCATASRPRSTRRRSGKSATRCSARNTRRNRKPI